MYDMWKTRSDIQELYVSETGMEILWVLEAKQRLANPYCIHDCVRAIVSAVFWWRKSYPFMEQYGFA
jgi:hypothetical protein